MRIVVLGGYGVFGSRLAELLVRDGHAVWLAGRNLDKARAAAARIGGQPLAVDLRENPGAIFALKPEIVIDAAGPFQAYGGNPYRIAALCIDHGADYLDLSDDADFTAGIRTLDERARLSGRRVLSGVSSVPALSSAVVAKLAEGCDEVLLIDTAILPGNRAPRGASVIASITGQVGRSLDVWRGGVWRKQRNWSDGARIHLAPNLERNAFLIGVPDLSLFPARFRARSVLFRAGMELGILNLALAGLARLQRLWPFTVTPKRAEAIRRLANLLLPFGTDRGGMRVAVVGRWRETVQRREWRLVAEGGDGPFVPGVAARALLRNFGAVEPGARPCLAELTLGAVDAAMADLSVTTTVEEGPCPTLFQAALADRWQLLPPEVRELHSVQDMESFSGTAEVTRGTSLIARFAAWFFGFPKAGGNVPVRVTKTRRGAGEVWERNFDGRVFRSFFTPAGVPYRYRERFWLFNYEQDLPVADGCMHLPVRRGWFLGVPVPRFLLPASDSREYSSGGVFHFDVALSAPLGGGLIVRYRGQLTPDRMDAAQKAVTAGSLP